MNRVISPPAACLRYGEEDEEEEAQGPDSSHGQNHHLQQTYSHRQYV